jgi:hypothetical protein
MKEHAIEFAVWLDKQRYIDLAFYDIEDKIDELYEHFIDEKQ